MKKKSVQMNKAAFLQEKLFYNGISINRMQNEMKNIQRGEQDE